MGSDCAPTGSSSISSLHLSACHAVSLKSYSWMQRVNVQNFPFVVGGAFGFSLYHLQRLCHTWKVGEIRSLLDISTTGFLFPGPSREMKMEHLVSLPVKCPSFVKALLQLCPPRPLNNHCQRKLAPKA